MNYFTVIVPAYNAERTIIRALKSIDRQTFQDFTVIVVDDCSEDGTYKAAKEFADKSKSRILTSLGKRRAFNGGARNIGINFCEALFEDSLGGKYTIFLDADDEFIDENVFQDIHDKLEAEGEPDMLRMPYVRIDQDGETIITSNKTPQILAEATMEQIAKSSRVACWTKVVKTELLQPFPENTLMEDVVQHLKQCDVTKTFAILGRPTVIWHTHSDSTSRGNSPKWQSSAYRFVADLMDLKLTTPYCEERRQEKLRLAKEALAAGRFEQ